MRSSCIERLAERVADGDEDALASFWASVRDCGSPIVEAIENDPSHRLVTFVWRDDGDTRNVVVLWGPAPYWDVPANAFEQLPGTDLWFKTYRVRSDMRGRYILSQNDPLTPLAREGTEDARQRYQRFVPDPLNPDELVLPANPNDPRSIERRYSILELADAPRQPWAHRREDVAHGTIRRHRLHSAVLGNERDVWVHAPHPRDADGPLKLLVMLDGRVWTEHLPIEHTVDNLRADGLIPDLVTVLVDSLDWETRSRELTCHEPFLEFLTSELVAWVMRRWPVSDDPADRIVDGLSYGGLAALFAGLRRPDVFGNVVAHSPSLWWSPDGDPEPDWLIRQYERLPRVPTRTYVEMGLNEGPAMVPTGRRLRDVMVAKGYDLEYVEYNGGHDVNCWRGGMADALCRLAGSRTAVAHG